MFSGFDSNKKAICTPSPCIKTDWRCEKFTFYDNINGDKELIKNELAEAIVSINSSRNNKTRSLNTFNHIRFANFDSNLLDKRDLEVLEDKFHLLSHHRKNENVYYVVIFLKSNETNKIYSRYQLDQLAEYAINEVNTDNKKIALNIISSSNYESILWVNTEKCYSLGFAQTGNLTSIDSAVQGGDIFQDILKHYSDIEKPLNLYVTAVLADGSFLNLYKRTNKNIKGYPLINALGIIKSPYYDQLKELREKKPKYPSSSDYDDDSDYRDAVSQYHKDYKKWKEKYDALKLLASQKDKEAVDNKDTNYFENVPGTIELREVYINDESLKNQLQIQYANWHFSKQEYGSLLADISYMFGSYDNFDSSIHLYQKIDTNRIIYGTFDAVSLFLAPVGLDIIPDTLGFLYAVYHNDTAQAGGYAVGIVAFSYAQYAVGAYKTFSLVKKVDDQGDVVKYLLKNQDEALLAGESQVSSVLGRNLDDATNIVKSEFGFDVLQNLDEALPALKSFIDDITLSGWDDTIKSALKSDLEDIANSGIRNLFTQADNATKIELAKSWKILHDSGKSLKTNPNALVVFKNLDQSGYTALRSRMLDELSDDLLKKFSDDYLDANDLSSFNQKFGGNDKMFDAWKRLRQEDPLVPLCN